MNTKQKYIRLGIFDEIVIFPEVMQHKEFKSFNAESARFCYVNGDKKTVECFGESVSLGLKSNPEEDSLTATKQIFGIEATDRLQKIYNESKNKTNEGK
jgi:hypothetical protein